MKISVAEIAAMIEGEVEGDEDLVILRPNTIEKAQEGEISFLADKKYEKYLYESTASAVLVSKDFVPSSNNHPTLIRVDNIREKLMLLQSKLNEINHKNSGVSPNASVHSSVLVKDSCFVDDFVVIKEHSTIGSRTEIHAHVFIGHSCKIGENVTLHSGVKLYPETEIGDNCIVHANTVIGSDGFGFVPDKEGKYQKMPHSGRVVIGKDVEIGANAVIDRATMGVTIIREGTKLDNLIQVAHNVEIGSHTVIAAQTGIAGSSKIGSHCMIGGQVGIAGHLQIEDGVKIQAQSGINKKLEKGQSYYGSPALRYVDFLRSYSCFRNLPSFEDRLDKLEGFVKEMSKRDQ